MPPWRTTVETFVASSPHSCATAARASSAELFCCTSKSGGTYSASITGVIGMTLTSRTAPLLPRASATAVSSAGLTNSGSARSTGTRILWYMAGSSQKRARTVHSATTRRPARVQSAGGLLGSGLAAPQQVAGDVGERRLGQGRERERTRHLDRREAEARGEKPVQHALAESGGELGGDAVAEHLLDQAIPGGKPAREGKMRDDVAYEPDQAEEARPAAIKRGEAVDHAKRGDQHEGHVDRGARADRGAERNAFGGAGDH